MIQSDDATSFSRIRTGTLRGDLPIDFDLYVAIAGKFILYCKRGDSFEGERLDRLTKKNIERLFVKVEDLPTYQRYLNKNIERAFNTSEELDPQSKAEIVQGYLESTLQDLLDELEAKALYKVLQQGAVKLQKFLEGDSRAFKDLISIKNSSKSLLQHSVNVAAWSLELAKALEIPEGEERDLLALGAFLHDLELILDSSWRHSQLEEAKKGAEEANEIYQRHPSRGAERLIKAGFYERDVIEIVQDHHELSDESGFPDQKGEKKTSRHSQIVATANAFEGLLSFQQLSLKEALRQFLIDGMGVHPLSVLQGLQKVSKKHNLI